MKNKPPFLGAARVFRDCCDKYLDINKKKFSAWQLAVVCDIAKNMALGIGTVEIPIRQGNREIIEALDYYYLWIGDECIYSEKAKGTEEDTKALPEESQCRTNEYYKQASELKKEVDFYRDIIKTLTEKK